MSFDSRWKSRWLGMRAGRRTLRVVAQRVVVSTALVEALDSMSVVVYLRLR